MAIRDSGYTRVPGGNVAVDFSWGNMPPQTNDDRTGIAVATVTAASSNGFAITYTATNSFAAGQRVTITGLSTPLFNLTDALISSASGSQFTIASNVVGAAVSGASGVAQVFVYNATGGTTGSAGSDNFSAQVTAASATAGTITYTANNEFTAGGPVTVTGLNGSVAITAISGSGTVVTYSTASTTGLSAGQTISITGATTGAYNLTNATILAVVANTNFTITSTATGATSTATGTYSSAFNLTNATVATASATQFTVTSAVTDRAVAGATGSAIQNVEIIPGLGADFGWGKTTDYQSSPLVQTQLTRNVGQITLTVPADNVVNVLNNFDAFPANAQSAYKPSGTQGNFNPAYTQTAVVTGASGNGTTVTYVANNSFTAGQTVTITGLYNYVLAGQTQPIATAIYTPTYTTPSVFNLGPVTIATANATGFTVTNSTTGTALVNTNGSVYGVATATVAASASTATVPTVTGLTVKEADRLLGVADFNTGTVTTTTSGATAANAGTVYSQSITGTQTLGTTVNLVIYALPDAARPGTQAGTYTYVA